MRTLAPDLKGVCTTCSYETEWFGEFEDFNAQLGVCPKCGHELELFDGFKDESKSITNSGWIRTKHPRVVCPKILGSQKLQRKIKPRRQPINARTSEFEIINQDERKLILDTTAVPFRWICNLLMCFRHPTHSSKRITFLGNGILIADKYVLTVAHNLYNFVPDNANQLRGPFPALSVLVTPGLNGAKKTHIRSRPFGSTYATQIRVSEQWRKHLDSAGKAQSATSLKKVREAAQQHDFALIKLADAIGNQTFDAIGGEKLGFWGSGTHGYHTLIKPKSPSSLTGVEVNVVGYPGDKCREQPADRGLTPEEEKKCSPLDIGTTQWASFDRVKQGSIPGEIRLMSYENDTVVGNSGSPVWLRWKAFRNLIAIHRGPCSDCTSSQCTCNEGVRITDQLLSEIRSWM